MDFDLNMHCKDIETEKKCVCLLLDLSRFIDIAQFDYTLYGDGGGLEWQAYVHLNGTCKQTKSKMTMKNL